MAFKVYKYRPVFFFLLLSLTGFALSTTIVQATTNVRQSPVTLVTGLKTGTYYIFGRDIFEMAKKASFEVNVKTSEGSIDNIKRISNGANAVLGIVQSDVLGFLRRSKNPDSMKVAKNLRMVFPFYNEEIHVLASKEIKSFKDLQGKKVAIGEEGSGNMLTSINLFSMAGISPSDSQKISSAKGVVAVLKGEIDAVIFVGGKPVRLFKNLEDLSLPANKKYSHMLENVHFIPLNGVKMLEEYKPAQLLPSDYKFVKKPVQTVSVQAVLISYNFSKSDKSKNSRNIKRCEQISDFADNLRAGLPVLKKTGHAKWKEVNLDGKIGTWKKDNCVWGLLSTPAKSKKTSEDLLNILVR